MLKTMITKPTIREKFLEGIKNKGEGDPGSYTMKYLGVTDGKIGILSTKIPMS